MIKLLIRIAVIVLLIAISIIGISAYLAPDDIAHCGSSPSVKENCSKADAIVAVSGGDTSARAAEAIKLYKLGWAKMIIFSGAAADKSGPSNAEVMAQQAIDTGIDPNSIITENNSETTDQNASQTKTIFDEYHIRSAIIVTSGYHERRAMLEFQQRAPSVWFRAHPVASDKQWGPWWWTTPVGWILAVPELVKSIILTAGGSLDP